MEQNSQCSTYKLFKYCHEMEEYLLEVADVHKNSIANRKYKDYVYGRC